MKELSIEEKAIRYDEAIEKAKSKIKDDKDHVLYEDDIIDLFPELKIEESEDERIRKWCISHFKECINVVKDNDEYKEYLNNKVIPWFEKQGEHANFRNKIHIGDKVTRNEDGVLVNLSQLNRVAKKDEKQGEQNHAWSEEDEQMLNDIVKDLVHPWNEYIPDRIEEEIKWLKNKLKSLRPRSQWKPSYVQMEVLLSEVTALTEGCNKQIVLKSLYNDLKKLREE